MRNIVAVLFVLLIGLFVLPRIVVAHKVIVFAWVEGGMIHTQSSFGSKRKAKNCTIIVKDENETIVNTGKTDSNGLYTFKMPEKLFSDLVVYLDAKNGHKASWRIPKEELIPETDKTFEMTAKKNQDIRKEREEMDKSPSLLKIMGGIGIIFFLAFLAAVLKKRKNHQ